MQLAGGAQGNGVLEELFCGHVEKGHLLGGVSAVDGVGVAAEVVAADHVPDRVVAEAGPRGATGEAGYVAHGGGAGLCARVYLGRRRCPCGAASATLWRRRRGSASGGSTCARRRRARRGPGCFCRVVDGAPELGRGDVRLDVVGHVRGNAGLGHRGG